MLWMRPEEKKMPLLACLVRGKKIWRLWLGVGDVRSADGYKREKEVMDERERRDGCGDKENRVGVR